MSGLEDRAKRVSIGGAVLAALAASSCCLGPLLLGALGIGGAGAAGALGSYRPYLLAGTAVLLIAGFYFTYRKPREVGDPVCGCERPRVNRAGRVSLWIGTVIVVLVAAAPTVLARWAEGKRPAATSGTEASLATTVIGVPGIDCAACAAPIRGALAKAGGFHDLKLDITKQAVTVTYEPAPGRLAAYIAAIDGLGYEAKVSSESEARQ
jgi:mercuric ion transport protein